MILRKESTYTPIQPGRFIPYWRRMIDSVQRQQKLGKDRYLRSEQRATPSVIFIKTILDKFDGSQLEGDDDFAIYNQYLVPQAKLIGKMFYPMVNTPRINRFCDKPIHELMLPTTGIVDNINLSPMDDWDRWQEAKPFRLLSHDTLSLNFPEDQLYLRYKQDKPTYLAFGIDIAAMLMMFVKFIKSSGTNFREVDREKFIQKYVLATIYDDILDCWLMNFLLATLEDDDIVDRMLEVTRSNMFIGISSLNLAYSDIVDLVTRTGDDKIRLSAILNTELFQDGTLLDIMKLHERTMVVGKDNRSIGFELIKSSALLEVLTNIIELRPDKTTKLRRQFAFEYGIMTRSNWKSHVIDKSLRAIATNTLTTLTLIR